MARRTTVLLLFLLVITITILFSVCSCFSVLETNGFGGKIVGGWKEIKDVKNNKEVQQLGRFSVEEYNQRKGGDVGGSIVFSEVIEAKRQVVSGLKYLLKVAVEENEIADTFDAVVVVKPWIRSKELVAFAPSTK
ncbi:hypothetical protein AQUCO_07500041v1 [Aquilegia coerulea]|uniref:Cystatin domain-containing protein n=1 Tax=Aquilegia coerulea TaxID=218851 RepID=A0A2G5C9A9_AQUCA|nr:hypothetical protein AQUCO_07500041v1 [Aquilegia coerulea]